MGKAVLRFQEIPEDALSLVGGKGLNLGILASLDGIRVPEGFCVTTEAYRETIAGDPVLLELIRSLNGLDPAETARIRNDSERIRQRIQSLELPDSLKQAVRNVLQELGSDQAYAIRSSATAEDLPSASFAGQHDSYLNIRGETEVLEHIRRCWASLFTERAVTYRARNGIPHSRVLLAVVIQQMVFPRVSGILFTADPITGNRRVLSIDASFGLGEALVSGVVTADNYRVRDGRVIGRTISRKQVIVSPDSAGGTREEAIRQEEQEKPALTEQEILALEETGRRIEAHFGTPQDIEWCLTDDSGRPVIWIVQSRPVTTLYPLPEPSDGKFRIYLSIGHQQMMTDPMLPLGLSFMNFLAPYQLTVAGGRLFLDLSHELSSWSGRKFLVKALGKNDPLIDQALREFLKREEQVRQLPKGKRLYKLGSDALSWSLPLKLVEQYRLNDYGTVLEIMEENERSLAETAQRLRNLSGDELFAAIIEDEKERARMLFDQRGLALILLGAYAAYWLNTKMKTWLGEENAAEELSLAAPGNVTAKMGLELLDVADVARPYPEVIAYLENPDKDTFLEDLKELPGGSAVREALEKYLQKYGMRCSGEIDITKTRWSEQPSLLAPVLVSNIKNFRPGEHRRRIEEGRKKAADKERELTARLMNLRGGRLKARKTRKMIRLLRQTLGFREYPKYVAICRYFFYKQALMREAEKLRQRGVIAAREDVYYLSFSEFREAVRTNQADRKQIEIRKAAYEWYDTLTPPRLITSEGEIITGTPKLAGLPPNTLVGTPVSSGIVEGRARVIRHIEEADLEEGDILVAAFTDPSWTPLFVLVKGLVTEVGGLMTHGAVIAREYGLPAVVSVDHATKIIRDGQQIRIDGAAGTVELLE